MKESRTKAEAALAEIQAGSRKDWTPITRMEGWVYVGGYVDGYEYAIANRGTVTKDTIRDAAPELLAALEESLKEMEAFRRYWTSPNMGLKRGVCRAEELASTAIAKAKGQP